MFFSDRISVASEIHYPGNALAYSTTFSILAVAAFNDQSEKVPLYQDYNLKGHGSVYLFTRQNTNPPVDATTPHNQFIFAAKLTSVDSSYVEYQRNHFGTAQRPFSVVAWNHIYSLDLRAYAVL
jgi:hypothetical protein